MRLKLTDAYTCRNDYKWFCDPEGNDCSEEIHENYKGTPTPIAGKKIELNTPYEMKITYFSDSYVQVSFDGYTCMYYETTIDNRDVKISINGNIDELAFDKTNQTWGNYTFEDNCSCNDNKCTGTGIFINKSPACNPDGAAPSLMLTVNLTLDDRKKKLSSYLGVELINIKCSKSQVDALPTDVPPGFQASQMVQQTPGTVTATIKFYQP